jgi:hypothetical protein
MHITADDGYVEETQYNFDNNSNEKIADQNDDREKLGRFVVWTDELHFVMDGRGNIISEVVANPIGRLPFIDVSEEKDHTYFVQRGNSVPEFTIDFLAQLSDQSNVSRLQGYSQAIIYSTEEPKDVFLGPMKVLWLKKDPNNAGSDPRFEFSTPSPDLSGSLEILNSQMKIFLSSLGLDSNVVSTTGNAKTFSSGVDHLLSQIDKFKASKQDIDIFRWAEGELFDLLRLWSNYLQPVVGEMELRPELKISSLSDSIDMTIKYVEPTSVLSMTEKEDSIIKRIDAGLLTKRDAIVELYEVNEDKADEMLLELENELPKLSLPAPPVSDQEPEEEIDETEVV